MSALAPGHNRLIDYAIIADLRGDQKAAFALRYSATLLAREINAECAARKAARR